MPLTDTVREFLIKFHLQISDLKKPLAFQCLLALWEIDLWRPPPHTHKTGARETTLTVAFVASASQDLGHITEEGTIEHVGGTSPDFGNRSVDIFDGSF